MDSRHHQRGSALHAFSPIVISNVASSRNDDDADELASQSSGGFGANSCSVAPSSITSSSSAVKVAIRVRPPSQREIDTKSPLVIVATENSLQIVNPIVFVDSHYLPLLSQTYSLDLLASTTLALPNTDASMRLNEDTLAAIATSGECRSFHFDRCFCFEQAQKIGFERSPNPVIDDVDGFSLKSNQELIFDEIGQEMIDSAFQGFNCTVLAYGQTGSGKTHTMVGTKSDQGKGLIPRVCEALFLGISTRRELDDQKQEASSCTKTIFSVHVSYIEIYKEKVNDLLGESHKVQSLDVQDASAAAGNATGRPNGAGSTENLLRRTNRLGPSPIVVDESTRRLKVREHPVTGPFVEGLVSRPVMSYAEIEEELLAGERVRTVACTLMNATSSRSHAIFTITFTQTTVDPVSLCAHDKTSKLCLVDLAGSERADVSGTSGERLKEGSMINKSLTTLGRVISSLTKGNHERVPYRDSTLTWLLKESLGGNARTTMIAMISPAADSYEETMSTLRYAESAKKVMNRAVINEDKNARIIRQLRQEIVELRAELTRIQQLNKIANAGLTASLSERETVFQQLQNEVALMTNSNSSTCSSADAVAKQELVAKLHPTWPSLINLNENLHATRNEPLAFFIAQGLTVFGRNPAQSHTALLHACPTSLLARKQLDDVNDFHWFELETAAEEADELIEANHVVFHLCAGNDEDRVVKTRATISLEMLHDSAKVKVNGIDMEAHKEYFVSHRDQICFGKHLVFRMFVPDDAADLRFTLTSPLKKSAATSPKSPRTKRSTSSASDTPSLEQLVSSPFGSGPMASTDAATALPMDRSTLAQLVQEANQLCELLHIEYRLDLDQDPSSFSSPLLHVCVVSPNAEKTWVRWEVSTFEQKLQLLRDLASISLAKDCGPVALSSTSSASSSPVNSPSKCLAKSSSPTHQAPNPSSQPTPQDPTQTLEMDPFFEVRSNAIRLLGHGKIFFAPSTLSNEAPLEFTSVVAIYSTDGKYVGSLQVDLQLLEASRSVTDALSPSERGRNKINEHGSKLWSHAHGQQQPQQQRQHQQHQQQEEKVQLKLLFHLKTIEFFAGVFSQGLYLTYRDQHDSKSQATPTASLISIHDATFNVDHAFSHYVTFSKPCSPLSPATGSPVDHRCLCVDVWGWGDLIPIRPEREFLTSLRDRVFGQPEQQQQQQQRQSPKSSNAALASSKGSPANLGKRRVSLPLAAKLDLFVSIDIEERTSDGIFHPVCVKTDGTLRLHQHRPRRLVIRIVQADHQWFCLSTITQVRLCQQQVDQPARGAARTTPALDRVLPYFRNPDKAVQCVVHALPGQANFGPHQQSDDRRRNQNQWITLRFRDQVVRDAASRTLLATLVWETHDAQSLAWMDQVNVRGTRQVYRVALALETSCSSVPVVVSKSIVTKMGTTKSRKSQQLVHQFEKNAWWASESFSRHQRLGAWFAVEIASQNQNQSQNQSQGQSQDRLDETSDEQDDQVVKLADSLLSAHTKGIQRLENAFLVEKFRQELLFAVRKQQEVDLADLQRLHNQHCADCGGIQNNNAKPVHQLFHVGGEIFFKTTLSHHAADREQPDDKDEDVKEEDLIVHLVTGAQVEAPDQPAATDSSSNPAASTALMPKQLNMAYFVTDPTSFDSHLAGEMCGFLMIATSFQMPSPSTSGTSSQPGGGSLGGGSGAMEAGGDGTRRSSMTGSSLSWDRRWFVLQRPFLYCFKSFARKSQLGVLDISKCQLVVAHAGGYTGATSNNICVGNRTTAAPGSKALSQPTKRRASLGGFFFPNRLFGHHEEHHPKQPTWLPFSFQLVHLGISKCVVWHLQASTASEMRAWLVAIDPLQIEARKSVVNKDFDTVPMTA